MIRLSKGLSQILKTESTDGSLTSMTGLMGGGMESWKLPCILFTLMMCIGSNGEILPDHSNGLSQIGLEDPILQDVSDVVLSACTSVFEMYQMFVSKELLYGDVDTLAYLVSNARYHHVRLAMLFKVLSDYKDGEDWSGCDMNWYLAIGGNKFHLLQHMVEAKRDLGADSRISDTELCEQMHIPSIREPFAATNKQDDNRQMNMAQVVVSKLALSWVRSYFGYEDVHGSEPATTLGDDSDGEEDVGDLEDEELTVDGDTLESRQRSVSSKESQYITLIFDDVTRVWKLPATTQKEFFHPLLTDDVLSDQVKIAVGNVKESYDILEVLLLNKARFHSPDDASDRDSDYYLHCHRNYPIGRRGSVANVQYTSCFSGVLYNENGGRQSYGRIAAILLLRWKTGVNAGHPWFGHRHDFIVIPVVEVDTPSYLPYPLYKMETDPMEFSYTPQERVVECCLVVLAAGFGTEALGMETKEMFINETRPVLFYVFDRDRFRYPKPNQLTPLTETHFVDETSDNTPCVMPAGEGESCKVFLPTDKLQAIQLRLGLTEFLRYAD
jgi:hypothetical protein